MTVPFERTHAVRRARCLLEALADSKRTPRVPRGVRKEAAALLRHFPSDADLRWTADALPYLWASPDARER